MKLSKITNVKHFMNKLLIENTFDSFLISEAVIKTYSTFIIDGHINDDYYSDSEISDLISEAESEGREYSTALIRWGKIKSNVLSLIKGNKTPLYFKISFYLAGENVNKLLTNAETSFLAGDIDGLALIVKYDKGELTVTSSATLNIFSLDKSLEKYWDDMVIRFLTSNGIECEIF